MGCKNGINNEEKRIKGAPLLNWTRKHVLGIEEMTTEEILITFEKAAEYLEGIEKKPGGILSDLKGYTAVNLFFEPSTRTRMSFELAQKRLGMEVINFSAGTSSLAKGETFIDTIQTIDAMNIDAIVMRHVQPGTPELATRYTDCPVLNGGDGSRAHPTQALLDLFTIWNRGIDFEGLKVAIVGDILHSRVARSEVLGLQKLGAEIILVGPPALIPGDLVSRGMEIEHDIDNIIEDIDILYLLRIQKERMAEAFIPNEEEYFKIYGINKDRLAKTKENCYLMHPGPVNRGVEIEAGLVNHPKSLILEQVRNGVAMRMALLSLCIKGS